MNTEARPARPNGGGSERGRRAFLAGILAIGTAALAGCVGGGSGGDEDSDGDDGDDQEPPPEELDIGDRHLDPGFPLRVYEPNSDELVTEYQFHEGGSHWHFQPLQIPLNESRTVEVRLIDQDLNRVPIGPEEDYYLAVRPSEETPPDLFDVQVSGDLVTFDGASSGTGAVLFELYRAEDDALVWAPKSIEVTVG